MPRMYNLIPGLYFLMIKYGLMIFDPAAGYSMQLAMVASLQCWKIINWDQVKFTLTSISINSF